MVYRYGTTFCQSTLGGLPADAHMPLEQEQIRVDSARTPEFKNAFSQVTNEASVLTGSKLVTIQEFIILMPITILKI
jgi:hypothetical protein